MKTTIDQLMEDFIKQRSKILDDFAKAYLMETMFRPSEVEMCEVRESTGTRIFFRKREPLGADKSRISLLERKLARAREGLEFYADKDNYYDPREIDGSDRNGIFKDSENILVNSSYISFGGKKARRIVADIDAMEGK